ncbi:zinc protease [Herbaspirillum sp. 1173]|uniref:M16 family metallopeptidase n=1 Tax=Herbaspirillum sp. 1173 TaxID=2817734 RepID=UPI002864DA62|nr:pitrilysin family protein [Herbaspirillum sp. 1173]MDR6739206.1 zinc protease [Herbaspirillum sp. 1173]
MSLSKSCSLVVVLLLNLASFSLSFRLAPAQAQPAIPTDIHALPIGITAGPVTEGISEYRFSNGFRLLLLPDASQPTVTTNISYLVGSRHENYGETGMAHLLEHLLFKGTTRHPTITQEFSRRGMTFNAVTWVDSTNYHETFAASDDNLRWVIDMEADRMINSRISRKDLDTEMTVVRNEFENGENSPDQVMLKRIQGAALDWHAYGRPTIGNRSDIENVTINNLKAFYKTYYQPDNAVLVIAGKFDPVKVLGWVNLSFGKISKPSRKLPVFWTVEPTQDGERQFFIRRQGDVQLVSVAYRIAPQLHPDAKVLELAGAILTNPVDGRLQKCLVETGLAATVVQQELGAVAPGLQIITATVKKGGDLETVKRKLIAGVESLVVQPPTEEELARTKLTQINLYERLESNPQMMAMALNESILLGDWRQLFAQRDQIATISVEQIVAAAAKYYRRDNRTVGMFIPEESPQRTEVPAALTMTQILAHYQPHASLKRGENFDTSPANIEKRTQVFQPMKGQNTPLKIALLPKKTSGGVVSVGLALDFGNASSLFGKQALNKMTMLMLQHGTTTMTRQQFAENWQRLKMSGDLLLFQTTGDNLIPALQLMGDALRHPRFDEDEFTQMRNELLVSLEASRGDPQFIANEALALHFNAYPSGDVRSAMSLDEQIAQVKNVSLEQIRQFYLHYYGVANGRLVIVGEFDPAAAIHALNQSFANWTSPAPYDRIISTWHDIAPIHRIIDTPDKENGVFMARQNVRLRDTDEDYAAMQAVNYLVGGSSKTRLNDRLRQRDGLSYTVLSVLNTDDFSDDANFSVMAIAAPQNLERVEAGVREELTRLLKDGFTVEELERAKSGILLMRQQSRADDLGLVAQWQNLLDRSLTPEWMRNRDASVSALTLEQVNAAARKHLDPSKLSVIIARDSTKAKTVGTK